MWTPALLAALALPLVYAQESSIKLLHRFYHPLLAESSFSERGAFVFTGNQVSFQPSSAFTQDLQSFGEALQQIEPSAFDRALYQVALQRDSDTLLDLSSVKLVSQSRFLDNTQSSLLETVQISFLPTH